MRQRLALLRLGILIICLPPGHAAAHEFLVGDPDGCCGAQKFDDCTARPGAQAESCQTGHRYVGQVENGGIEHFFRCLGIGCIGTQAPGPCIPDVADGAVAACTGPLRSCEAMPGSATCGVGTSACVPDGLAEPRVCAQPACLSGAIDLADGDGDGLLDCWEQQGIDYDGDGAVDYRIPNANPQRRDLYVEIDAMACAGGGDCAMGDLHTHVPDPNALATVVAAFAAAPVLNPDGTTGIRLQVDVDETLPHQQACAFDTTCFQPMKTARFGTAAERANANLIAAKKVVYHYNLWAHSLSCDAAGTCDSTSGFANSAGDFIVTLGRWTSSVGNVDEQAGTFMHELGHNLGLGHGGADDVNHKPNYLSVMSYRWQTAGLRRTAAPATPIFDYSSEDLADLSESSLNENTGLQLSPGSAAAAFDTSWSCPTGGRNVQSASAALDWNCTPPASENPVASDINQDRDCVRAGPDGNLDSAPVGDDVRLGGTIRPGANGTLDTAPTGDDVVIGASVAVGANGILDTAPAIDDVVRNTAVSDGADRICNTAVVGDDERRRAVGGVQPATLTGHDDWANLQFAFATQPDFSPGDTLFGTESPIVELTFAEARQIALENTRADLVISQTVHRVANQPALRIQIRVTNRGPLTASSPTINYRLPAGTTFVACTASASGTCFGWSRYRAVSFPTLASGDTASAEILVSLVSSPAPDSRHEVSVEAETTDPTRVDSRVSTCLLPPFLSDLPAVVAPLCTPGAEISLAVPDARAACADAGPVVVRGELFELNGAALLPPIPLVNGRAVVGDGAARVRWVAVDAGGNTSTVEQRVDVIARPALSASGSLTLGDRARVQRTSGAPGPLSNRGAGLTVLGVESRAGSIMAAGQLDLRDRAAIDGPVQIGGTLTRGNGVSIVGPVVTGSTPRFLPAAALPPALPRTSVNVVVEPDTNLTRTAGSYGDVVVKSRGTLTLGAGTFQAQTLVLEPGSRLLVSAQTSLQVAARVTLRGLVASAGPGAATPRFAYAGTEPVFVEAPFTGSILAPNAKLILGTVGGTSYRGEFTARDIEIAAAALVMHDPAACTPGL